MPAPRGIQRHVEMPERRHHVQHVAVLQRVVRPTPKTRRRDYALRPIRSVPSSTPEQDRVRATEVAAIDVRTQRQVLALHEAVLVAKKASGTANVIATASLVSRSIRATTARGWICSSAMRPPGWGAACRPVTIACLDKCVAETAFPPADDLGVRYARPGLPPCSSPAGIPVPCGHAQCGFAQYRIDLIAPMCGERADIGCDARSDQIDLDGIRGTNISPVYIQTSPRLPPASGRAIRRCHHPAERIHSHPNARRDRRLRSPQWPRSRRIRVSLDCASARGRTADAETFEQELPRHRIGVVAVRQLGRSAGCESRRRRAGTRADPRRGPCRYNAPRLPLRKSAIRAPGR